MLQRKKNERTQEKTEAVKDTDCYINKKKINKNRRKRIKKSSS